MYDYNIKDKGVFMDFGKWIGVNDAPDQIKRLKSAKTAACTPLSVSVEECCGVFSGSHGTYNTTIDSCTCVDFVRRKLPCKHIYRLAIELGELHESAESDLRKVKRKTPIGYSLPDAVAVLETLSDDGRAKLHDILYLIFYNKKRDVVGVIVDDAFAELVNAGVLTVCDDLLTALGVLGRNEIRGRLIASGVSDFKKTMCHDDLARWVCDNVPDALTIFADAVAVMLSDDFVGVSRKIYTYLNRRDRVEYYMDEEANEHEIPKGAQCIVTVSSRSGSSLSLEFPDDEITALLDHYGVNRCRK